MIKTIDNKVMRILVSSALNRTRAVEDRVDRIILDEFVDQRLTEPERKVSVGLESDLGQRQPVGQMTEMLPSINRPTTLPMVFARAIWDYHPGL